MGREKREGLYVTVPSLFRCPISMDLMKSPVSLCTGVTYDRTSIQTWLSQGHNTCPATMQVLRSTDFTPNLTLRRLIHLWLHHQHPAGVTPSSSSSSSISRQQALHIIKNDLSIANDRLTSLRKIIDFVECSEENGKIIATSNDAVLEIIGVLDVCDEIEVCEAVVTVLDLILLENGVAEQLNRAILEANRDLLSRFVLILRKGSLHSKSKSARILESISINSESQRKISEELGLVHELYRLISAETEQFAVEAGSSALIAISSTTRPVKKELVRLGIIRTATKILADSKTVLAVVEKAIKLIEVIATCTEGRAAIGEDEECVVEIVKRLMKCSPAATEHGITVVWSVCCMAHDERAKERVVKVNGLTKILLVMQSDCSAGTRHMCGELVKALKGSKKDSFKSCLASYDTRTTHIMPY